jgi:hypothetical protein
MKKVYPDAKSALAGQLKDGMTIMAGGFGLCGIPETLIHAIETLHQLIEDGHLMKRRAETGAGANVHVQEIPSGAESIPVLLGTR